MKNAEKFCNKREGRTSGVMGGAFAGSRIGWSGVLCAL